MQFLLTRCRIPKVSVTARFRGLNPLFLLLFLKGAAWSLSFSKVEVREAQLLKAPESVILRNESSRSIPPTSGRLFLSVKAGGGAVPK